MACLVGSASSSKSRVEGAHQRKWVKSGRSGILCSSLPKNLFKHCRLAFWDTVFGRDHRVVQDRAACLSAHRPDFALPPESFPVPAEVAEAFHRMREKYSKARVRVQGR